MAETNTIQVRLVTPERILVDQTVNAVEVPGKSGYLEVLYGHAPLLSELGAGEVRLHGGEGGEQRFHVARGFVEVLPERVTILAESAVKPEDIDTGEAKEELEEGKKLWSEAGEDAEKYDEANELIREAESLLESAQGGQKQG
ncbi:ATP synthase F1 subunit epsilon [Silvibacterium dinghuense]|uniref:ATP synthase epsilon chain n=1 Tax=Silvibacterium dinghuense TaxID=1560006 RepID=A0A4Q1SF24_9BACT|nr:ATP synthase F1 subunit epsilon [Silvibacterium dinghuense]RXS95508.1 ATP synthase F1 subunit epsilon [Silvibacterium dinghuense]GGH13658.1 ATP synthase epsilon chain [Silvibacterium dinghuense]